MPTDTIFVDEEKCEGCNKCISVCPVKANVAKAINGQNKVFVDTERCILCGACIKSCDHGARGYTDDTERFFNDLKNGVRISVAAAPSVRVNFPGGEYRRLIGLLKSFGVNAVFDVSFGADITTWAYLKAMKERGLSSVIAQPCPVIVRYIQKHRPELIGSLAPVHSPAMCAAVFMRDYCGITDRIAFLSPCLAKGDEFCDPNTKGYISYNITYAKLKAFLKANRISTSAAQPMEFDDPGCGLGLLFSRPGGLRENVRHYAGDDVWIRQVEGTHHACKYLDTYEKRLSEKRELPALVDILNCEYGCNLGTGTGCEAEIDEIDHYMNSLKNQTKKNDGRDLFSEFDKKLKLSSFMRKYENRRVTGVHTDEAKVEEAFRALNKTTPESRKINCYSCGYGNCLEFARAVARGENHVENCANYSRQLLINEKTYIFEACKAVKDSVEAITRLNSENAGVVNGISTSVGSLADITKTIKDSLETVNETSKEMKGSTRELESVSRQTKLIALNALIQAAHAGSYGTTFGIVAQEVRSLAEKSETTVEGAKLSEQQILDSINSTNELFGSAENNVTEINGSIQSITEHFTSVSEKCENVFSSMEELLELNKQ